MSANVDKQAQIIMSGIISSSSRLVCVSCYLAVACLLQYGLLQAQELPDVHFEHLSFDKEYKSWKRANVILQDNDGFLWCGTNEGLYRYDGKEMRAYFQTDDTTSLSNNSVRALFQDSRGKIWIGTYSGGISVYDPKTDQFERIPFSDVPGSTHMEF